MLRLSPLLTLPLPLLVLVLCLMVPLVRPIPPPRSQP